MAMNAVTAKRMVQGAGLVSIVFGFLLLVWIVLLGIALAPDLKSASSYVPCSGPMCELSAYDPNVIPLVSIVGAYFILLIAILLVYGNRIRQANRKDTTFYILNLIIIDFAVIFAIFPADSLGFRNFFIISSIINAVFLTGSLIGWHAYLKNLPAEDYKSPVPLWLKTVTMALAIVALILPILSWSVY